MSEEQAVSPLSEREMEVLGCLATGASNREIAQTLVISPNTVKVHIRKIYEKLGVQSRTEATRLAIEAGWIRLDGVTDTAIPRAATQTREVAALPAWKRMLLLLALIVAALILVLPQLPRTSGPTVLAEPVFGQCPVAAEPASVQLDTDRWDLHPVMPTARSRIALAGYDGKLYAIGGIRVSGATSLVEIFDPATEKWQEGASKPTQVGNIRGAIIDDRIFVPGGCASDGQALNVVEAYDLTTNSWATVAPLPGPRCGYALATRQGRLYVIGGSDGTEFVNTVFVYDPESDAWSNDAPPLPIKVGFGGATTLGDDIYHAGGYDGSREYSETFILKPGAQSWESGPPFNEPRGGLGLVETGGRLYAVGGGWTRDLPGNELFDPANKTWELFEAPRRRWLNPGVTTIEANIYAIGGSDGQCLNSVYSYKTLFQIFLPR